MIMPQKKIEWEGASIAVQPLPKGAFRQSSEAYAAIDGPALELNFNPPSRQLPDLRSILIYHGKDWRPDAREDQQQMHFALKGSLKEREVKSVRPGEKVYLSYQQSKGKGRYLFSPTPTSLWFEPRLEGEEAQVLVYLQRKDGEMVEAPLEHHLISLEERDLPRFGSNKWMLNGQRVDGSFLARQRGRWYGKDLFLEEHGGPEYIAMGEKERIQFGKDENIYAIHVGPGDFLVWKEKQWQRAELGEKTRGYPLLKLDKVEDRMLRFELWDIGGQRKVNVNLIRSNQMWRFPGALKVRFVGARTRTHSILEFDGERVIVGPNEWLLRQEKGWVKLNTIELIDEYVDGKRIGELFVCEGVQRQDGQQIFVAHVYSPTRTSVENIELSTQSSEVRIREAEAPASIKEEIIEIDDEEMPPVIIEHPDAFHLKSNRVKKKRRASSLIKRSAMIRRELQRGEGRGA